MTQIDKLAELEKLCEEALYETITQESDGKSVVRDRASGNLYFKKRLSVFNLQVFEYLRSNRSRFVPGVITFWQDGEELVVIEELIQGRTLDAILCDENAGTELPFAERIRILTNICEGVQFLHNAEPPIIHRDLKASNIMLTEDGSVKIIDYDAAKIYVEGQHKDTVLIGTQGLAAPEQYGFAQSNVRTDLYALGKLVERMLPDNEDALRIVERATKMDPQKRYASARQMKEQISRIREIVPSLDKKLERIPGYDSQNPKHRVMARLFIAMSGCAAVLAAVLCVYFFIILPKKQLAEATAALKQVSDSIENNDGWKTEAEHLKEFLRQYPYEALSDERNMEVRSCAEEIMLDCILVGTGSAVDNNLDRLCESLGELTGEEKVWERVRSYAQIRKMSRWREFDTALQTIKDVGKEIDSEGAANEKQDWEAHLQRLYEDIYAEGEKQEGIFRRASAGSKLSTPLEAYALIKADYAPAKEAYDTLYRDAVKMAEEKAEEKDFAESLLLYEQLNAHENVTEADIPAKISETSYAQAEERQKEGKFQEAYELFSGMADYGDAQERAAESAYLLGRQNMEDGNYAAAVEAFRLVPDYKDAGAMIKAAQYAYCEQKKEDPDDLAYEYLALLLEDGYEGADALRDELYLWRAEIDTGVAVSVGGYQVEQIRATLHGGPPDESIYVRFEIVDHVTGHSSSWTADERTARGGQISCTYTKDDLSWDLFERDFTVNVYDDAGHRIGTWSGKFTKDFLKD